MTFMKNIHILPTDKPSRLYTVNSIAKLDWSEGYLQPVDGATNQHIHITSNEKPKEGDWLIIIDDFETYVHEYKGDNLPTTYHKKIILTTDPKLIANSVQAISDEFLEWFVKNPSCEEIEVYKDKRLESEQDFHFYEIIIPKEELKQERKNCICKEPDFDVMKGLCKVCGNSIIHLGKRIEVSKQETLEEATKIFLGTRQEFYFRKDSLLYNYLIKISQFGAKWQQERSYSEEEVEDIVNKTVNRFCPYFSEDLKQKVATEWFEKFKKK